MSSIILSPQCYMQILLNFSQSKAKCTSYGIASKSSKIFLSVVSQGEASQAPSLSKAKSRFLITAHAYGRRVPGDFVPSPALLPCISPG